MVTKITILLKSKTKKIHYALQTILGLLHHTAFAEIFSIFCPAHLRDFVMVSIIRSDFNKNRLELI